MLADKGYQGCDSIIVPFKRSLPLSQYQKEFNSVLGSMRVIVERALARIKRFGCLKVPWRHLFCFHHVVFKICAALAQLTIIFAPLDFYKFYFFS